MTATLALPEAPVGRDGGDWLTLDEVIVDAWEGLATGRAVRCPICAGTLSPRFGAGSAPVGGRCEDCGGELD